MNAIRWSLGLLALIAVAAASGSVAAGKKKPDAGAATVSSRFPDAQVYVDAHNAIRAEVKKPKGYPGAWAPLAQLAWSDEIAGTAQAWADQLRDTKKCALMHSDTRYGENLAGGQDVDAARAVQIWLSEGARYSYSPVYDFDPKTGHYTQLVWRKTTHIGCGRATCGRRSIVVCRYSPAGNHIGRDPY